MIKLYALFLTITLTTSGCNIHFPVLPNVNLKDLLGDGTSEPHVTPTTSPETPTTPPSNGVLATLTLAADLVDELDLTANKNCVQLFQEAGKPIIIQFSGEACPVNGAGIAPSKVLYSAKYAHIHGDTYSLTYNGTKLGEMELSSDGEQLELLSLCTGSFVSKCYQGVSAGKLSGKPIVW